ncbi:unnamed protein product [Prorocentrum cordatum]|uniref:Uncharacterized protein n=1 Tax=Prorocentrum cordatum TaxID=2364126 RepID=A0ABN9TNP8_9DINO|nr:unnamed protein product [Polarella glacialis]
MQDVGSASMPGDSEGDAASCPRSMHVVGRSAGQENHDICGEYVHVGQHHGFAVYQKLGSATAIRYLRSMHRWVIDRAGVRESDVCVAWANDSVGSIHPARADLIWHVWDVTSQVHVRVGDKQRGALPGPGSGRVGSRGRPDGAAAARPRRGQAGPGRAARRGPEAEAAGRGRRGRGARPEARRPRRPGVAASDLRGRLSRCLGGPGGAAAAGRPTCGPAASLARGGSLGSPGAPEPLSLRAAEPIRFTQGKSWAARDGRVQTRCADEFCIRPYGDLPLLSISGPLITPTSLEGQRRSS